MKKRRSTFRGTGSPFDQEIRRRAEAAQGERLTGEAFDAILKRIEETIRREKSRVFYGFDPGAVFDETVYPSTSSSAGAKWTHFGQGGDSGGWNSPGYEAPVRERSPFALWAYQETAEDPGVACAAAELREARGLPLTGPDAYPATVRLTLIEAATAKLLARVQRALTGDRHV